MTRMHKEKQKSHTSNNQYSHYQGIIWQSTKLNTAESLKWLSTGEGAVALSLTASKNSTRDGLVEPLLNILLKEKNVALYKEAVD